MLINRSSLPTLGILLLVGNLTAVAKPKTATPVKVRVSQVFDDPYRYNGAVTRGNYRGSGFCAWNSKVFFSAAHLVYVDGVWEAPPVFYPVANSTILDAANAIPSRGYFRWVDFASLSDTFEKEQKEFGRDVIVAFAFEKFIGGKPAKLNLNGFKDLQSKRKSLITGYPAENDYLEQSIDGFFLHKTGPLISPYERFSGSSLITTLVATGGGNSGGPIWTKNSKGEWIASGVLVGGLPSEAVVYAFSGEINGLLDAVTPVVKSKMEITDRDDDIGSYSTFFPSNKVTKIPDGRKEWTSIGIPVKTFLPGSKIKTISMSLDIRTKHRGDLQVILEGPGGFYYPIHNEQGAGKNNIIIVNKDITVVPTTPDTKPDPSAGFSGIDPAGTWYLRIQDRLRGDVATFNSVVLEITADEPVTPPAP